MKEIIQDYIKKLCLEQESLIARYINSTGFKPEDICIVEQETATGRVFFPALKADHIITEDAK